MIENVKLENTSLELAEDIYNADIDSLFPCSNWTIFWCYYTVELHMNTLFYSNMRQ